MCVFSLQNLENCWKRDLAVKCRTPSWPHPVIWHQAHNTGLRLTTGSTTVRIGQPYYSLHPQVLRVRHSKLKPNYISWSLIECNFKASDQQKINQSYLRLLNYWVYTQTQSNSCWKWPQEVSSLTSSSKQNKLRGETGMLRDFPRPIPKTSDVVCCRLHNVSWRPAPLPGVLMERNSLLCSATSSCTDTIYNCEGPISISISFSGPWASVVTLTQSHIQNACESTPAPPPLHWWRWYRGQIPQIFRQAVTADTSLQCQYTTSFAFKNKSSL